MKIQRRRAMKMLHMKALSRCAASSFGGMAQVLMTVDELNRIGQNYLKHCVHV